MAGSVNKVVLVGNLGRDPEIRHSTNGKKIASFSVATTDTWKDANGERQEKTEWHRIVVFNPNIADFTEKYIKKGSKVYVEGALQTRKWTDNNGQERYSTEIVISQFKGELVILDSARSDDNGSGRASSGSADSGWDKTPDMATPATFDDEIPF